jgi:hypothetical protein
MRTFKRPRGFLTFAQNGKEDYLRMAYGLALSLKITQAEPYLAVVVSPGTEVPDKYRAVFDEVIDVPWLDEARDSVWKLENEWKAYHVTPYEETIKLDADMLFTSDIAEWWPLLARQEMVACTTVETYRGEMISSDFYRKCFTANALPNIYTAMLYFRISQPAMKVFDLAQTIFHNWQRFFTEFLEPITRPQMVSTDVVFALAIKLLDANDCIFPTLPVPRFVHMKTRLQNWPAIIDGEDWTKHIQVNLTDVMKLGRHRQHLPLHYHIKTFLTDAMLQHYECRWLSTTL